MTEIKIEKKKPVWPWILLILVLAAVIYYFATQDADNTDDSEIDTIENTTSVPSKQEINAVYV